MKESLKNRFRLFLASTQGVEVIDDLISFGTYKNKQRADYLFADRRIVIELKTFMTDPSPKVEKELNKHESRDDYPVSYGKVELQEILQHLPDGEKINKRIYRKVTRSVKNAIRSAEDQIRDTKEIFALNESVGLLVLLNEDISVLAPEIVVHKASELLSRKNKATETEVPIDFVWLIVESHVSELPENTYAFPSVLLKGSRADALGWFTEPFERLQKAWAKFNNAPLVQSSIEKITELSFRTLHK
ncbi:MAG: hypothetical protein WA240_02225 [Nitrospirota bacterium]